MIDACMTISFYIFHNNFTKLILTSFSFNFFLNIIEIKRFPTVYNFNNPIYIILLFTKKNPKAFSFGDVFLPKLYYNSIIILI